MTRSQHPQGRKPALRKPQGNTYDCTLRMPKQEIDALRQQLDANRSMQAESLRHYRRWPFERQPVTVRMDHPGGMVTNLRYACRNLSNGGISILHTSFVHTGTRCVVTLAALDSSVIEVQGEVTRCEHRRGKIHEIGIRFDQPIDVREAINLNSGDNSLVMESIQPGQLSGSLLIVDESELNRVYIRKCLAATQLNVVAAASGADGFERSKERFDLILCGHQLTDMTGNEFVAKLRAAQSRTPVILITPSDGTPSQQPGDQAAPDAVVPTPLKTQRLIGAIAQFLLNDLNGGAYGPLQSSLEPSDPAYALIPNFTAEVRTLAGELANAVANSDAAACRRISLKLRGAASTFGFEQLRVAADAAYSAIEDGAPIDDTARELLENLLSVCHRVREPAQEAA